MEDFGVVVELLQNLNLSEGVAVDLLKRFADPDHNLRVVALEEIDELPFRDSGFLVFVRIAVAEVSQLPVELFPELAPQHLK